MTASKQQTATFFIDESGAKASSGNFFVVAGKAQVAWDLARSLGVRDFAQDTRRGRVTS
jgi:hypothetical protein